MKLLRKHTLSSTGAYIAVLMGILSPVIILGIVGCGDGEKSLTHTGKLVSLIMEHRNVVEHSGEGGPQISMLVTRGRVKGAIPEDGVKVNYSVNDGPFQSLVMRKTASGRRFIATLPEQEKGAKIRYYIEVNHRTGKKLTFPGEAQAGNYFTINIK
ncbi:MAG: hypothetical protein ACE5OP_09720 [Candidatus Glassbacteria bacterium]